MKKTILFLASLFFSASLFAQVNIDTLWTFTNCGQEGSLGPDQTQVNNEYSGTSLDGSVISNDGIQEWVVPTSGLYSIKVLGAAGGENDNPNIGGNGAYTKGDFILIAGDELQILVGQKGPEATGEGSGGGGGTFVVNSPIPLIIAGGGGGESGNNPYDDGHPSTIVENVLLGNGGQGDCGFNSNEEAGGGGGYSYNGQNCGNASGGTSFLNGGYGSIGYDSQGGFGGGGGQYSDGGGGGGGASGGDGNQYGGGFGGTSYNSGENQDNVAGYNTGHGQVIITFLGFGCTDSTACNYSEYALEDDGTCIDENDEITFNCTNLNYTDTILSDYIQVYYNIPTLTGTCNEPYLISGPERGATFSIGTTEVVWAYTLSDSSEISCVFSVHLDLLACTDSTALNYNVSSTIDDGSCEYHTELGTLECGVTLEQSGATTSNIGFENSVYYSFEVDTASALLLSLDGYSSMQDPYVLLFDSSETYLQTISYTQNYYINETSLDLDSGAYYMVVTEDNPGFYGGSLQDYYSSMLTNSQNTGSFILSLVTYDGSCDYPGCMDSTAFNFNVSATVDDGSCEYPTDLGILECGVTLEQSGATTSTYGFENSVYYSFEVDTASELLLNLDGYSSMQDPYVLLFDSTETYLQTISYTELYYINQTSLDLDSGQYYMVVTEDNPGFNLDVESCAYFETTTVDCTGLSNLVINMYDSYGDGWNGANLIVNGQVFTFENGSEASSTVCADLTSDCIEVLCSGGSYPTEVSWTISDSIGNVLLTSGANYAGGIGECSGISPVCNGTLQDYYSSMLTNPQDTGSFTLSLVTYDGSCDYPGCTDTTAFNFNVSATIDDGSCEYPTDLGTLGCGITLEQSGATTSSIGFENSVYYSFSLDTISGLILDGYSSMQDPYVLLFDSTETYLQTISYTQNYYINETSLDLDSGAYYMVVTEDNPGFSSGSMQDYYTAMLTNSQNTGSFTLSLVTYDGSCDYPGCTDTTAFNFNVSATIDDGSCALPFYCTNEYILYSGSGNGTINLFSNNNILDEIVIVGSDGSGFGWGTDYGSPTYISFVALNDALLSFDWSFSTTDGYAYEQGYIIINDQATFLNDNVASGYYSSQIFEGDIITFLEDATDGCCGSGIMTFSNIEFECGLLGCTDSLAFNYDSLVLEDDSSCYPIIDGCTQEWADNYIATTGDVFIDVNTDDGSCYRYGCTYEWAVNYDEQATIDDGSCIPPIYGCTDSLAINFDPVANVDDGSCIYPYYGCTQDWANNYDVIANIDDGTCFRLGCMSSWADNYDSLSTIDDSSCYRVGCLYPFASNYDLFATIDDGSCIITGCLDSLADNYNDYDFDGISDLFDFDSGYNVNFDDGSCIIPGCTDIIAINYNEIANLEDGSCEYICSVPDTWEHEITGTNHTLMIPADVSIQVNGATIASGSTIGVFYTNDSGELQCAGYTAVTGEITFIAVMGDDSTTEEIDGLQAGEELVWMAWDINTCAQYELSATYSSGSTTFTPNGLTFLESLNHYTCQSIAFPGGWYMYSSYIQAEDMDAEVVLSSLEENLVILKDNDGNAYLTEWDFNGVGELDFRQGYQIKTNSPDTLEICGLQKYPEANPLFISQGWNLISYLRENPSPVDVVLENMNSTGNLLLVKDFNGNPYLPEWNYNGIGDMQPGQGYQLKTINSDTLAYLSNDLEYRLSTDLVIDTRTSYFERALNTGNNMQIVIPENVLGVDIEVGSEIAAYNTEGTLIGSTSVSTATTVLTVWGDDETTAQKDGLLIGEEINFKIWNKNLVQDFKIENWSVGSNHYEVNAIMVASGTTYASSNTTTLFDAVPNPSFEITNVSFSISESAIVNVSIYNVIGELVHVLTNTSYLAGTHNLEFSVSHIEAGSYFYTMSSEGFTKTKQLLILK